MTGRTRAQELAEKAARLNAARQQQHPAPAVPVQETTPAPVRPAAAETPLVKPVRTTLDLPPAVHRDLQAWLNESATRLGKARLSKQQALEALVRRLLVDETLSKLILADLKEGQ